MEEATGITILHKALRAEQYVQLVTVIVLFLLGGFLLAKSSLILAILAGIFLFTACFFSISLVREWGVERSKLMRVLNEEPERIVWVYSIVTQRMPFGLQLFKNSTLYIKLIDKEEFSVGIPEQYLKIVTRALNKKLPKATFGFSQDKEQWYMANPELLIRH